LTKQCYPAERVKIPAEEIVKIKNIIDWVNDPSRAIPWAFALAIPLAVALLLARGCSEAEASPKWNLAISESWVINLEGTNRFLPATTRLAIPAIFKASENVSVVVKPRISWVFQAFKPHPGLILGTGFRVHHDLIVTTGVLYHLRLPYDGKSVDHLISPGIGVAIPLTDGIVWSPSVGIGKWVNGPCNVSFVPVELQFRLPW